MQTITIDSVKIRENRQRKDLGDLTDLKASLVNVGLINPIIIEQDAEDTCFYLIAGERRYTAWKELYAEGKVSNLIPCRVFSSLSPADKHLIELEENIKRKDLTWQEYCEAVDKMYELKGCQTNEIVQYIYEIKRVVLKDQDSYGQTQINQRCLQQIISQTPLQFAKENLLEFLTLLRMN